MQPLSLFLLTITVLPLIAFATIRFVRFARTTNVEMSPSVRNGVLGCEFGSFVGSVLLLKPWIVHFLVHGIGPVPWRSDGTITQVLVFCFIASAIVGAVVGMAM